MGQRITEDEMYFMQEKIRVYWFYKDKKKNGHEGVRDSP